MRLSTWDIRAHSSPHVSEVGQSEELLVRVSAGNAGNKPRNIFLVLPWSLGTLRNLYSWAAGAVSSDVTHDGLFQERSRNTKSRISWLQCLFPLILCLMDNLANSQIAILIFPTKNKKTKLKKKITWLLKHPHHILPSGRQYTVIRNRQKEKKFD